MTQNSLRCLTIRTISTRALAFRNKALQQQICDSVYMDIKDGNTIQGRRDYVNHVDNKLEIYEDKDNRLMEALTMMELLLWKMKMDDCCGQQNRTRRSKKMRMDDTAMRKHCRIRCGAETNIVIEHVLPYLDILCMES